MSDEPRRTSPPKGPRRQGRSREDPGRSGRPPPRGRGRTAEREITMPQSKYERIMMAAAEATRLNEEIRRKGTKLDRKVTIEALKRVDEGKVKSVVGGKGLEVEPRPVRPEATVETLFMSPPLLADSDSARRGSRRADRDGLSPGSREGVTMGWRVLADCSVTLGRHGRHRGIQGGGDRAPPDPGRDPRPGRDDPFRHASRLPARAGDALRGAGRDAHLPASRNRLAPIRAPGGGSRVGPAARRAGDREHPRQGGVRASATTCSRPRSWRAFRRSLFAPAMNWRMWQNPIVQRNVALLRELGHTFVGPEAGELACGETGIGTHGDAGGDRRCGAAPAARAHGRDAACW